MRQRESLIHKDCQLTCKIIFHDHLGTWNDGEAPDHIYAVVLPGGVVCFYISPCNPILTYLQTQHTLSAVLVCSSSPPFSGHC